ncbi:MAG: PilZ domain-containing protein [Myxococcota bacterium]
MRIWLELLHDYRRLVADVTAASLRGEVAFPERRRVLGLGDALGEVPPWCEPFGTPSPLPALRGAEAWLTAGGGFVGAEVRRASGGGLVLGCALRPLPGERVLVRVDEAGETFVFPARVAWTRDGRYGAVGVVFDGAPAREPAAPRWGTLRPDLRRGALLA